MSDVILEQIRAHTRDRHCRTVSSAQNLRSLTDDLKRHFQKNYPVMLDGALPRSTDHRNLLRQARESLTRGNNRSHMLPAAVMRESLDAIPAADTKDVISSVKAGFTAVGPKTGRIWWDKSILDNLEDVLSRLESPKAVLRFYDVTGLDPESGRWNESFDIDIEIEAHGKTIDFWSGDHAYIVDLGYIHDDGRFLLLARTNLVHLPRDGQGARDEGEVARSILKPRQPQTDPEVRPDELARTWAADRRDHEERDWETELVVHMVYRSFLREGPRALRRSPRLYRRDPEVLRKEFIQRQRVRERADVIPCLSSVTPVVLAARLDPVQVVERPSARNEFLPAVVVKPEEGVIARGVVGGERFAWHDLLLRQMRRVSFGADGVLPLGSGEPVIRVETESEESDSGRVVSFVSDSSAPNSVFAAAESLRSSLSAMSSLDADLISGEADAGKELVEPYVEREHLRKREKSEGSESVRIFGGSEAKRMAKAGVRITRMALTLEGRMRPGARLKVAGKLVHADADGRFRLECVLTGKRASIPMRAGASIGGEARSLINVEWEKRASREKKKVW